MVKSRRPDKTVKHEMFEALRTGLVPSEDENGRPLKPPTEEALKAAWEANREAIMSEFTPNQRPWAWWAFDAEGKAILARAGRSWPLTAIGRRGGCRIRNRNALSAFEQQRLLAGATLPRVEPHAPTRNIVM